MPLDLDKYVEEQLNKRKGNPQPIPRNRQEVLQQRLQQKEEERKRQAEQRRRKARGERHIEDIDYDFSRANLGNIGDEETNAYHNRERIAKRMPGSNLNNRIEPGLNYDQNGNVRSKDLEASDYTGFVDHASKSFKKNAYEFVGGFADMARVVGAGLEHAFGGDFDEALVEGNIIQQAIDAAIENGRMESEYNLPPELQKETYTFSDFLSPVFWAEFGGGAIPELADIIASVYLTGGTKTIAQKGLQGIARKFAKEGVEEVGNKVIGNALKTTAREAAENASRKNFISSMLGQAKATTMTENGVKEVIGSGKGLLGKVMTDRGNFTQSFDDLVTPVLSGAYSNLQTSLKAGGDMYNTYSQLYQKDEFGRVITDEEGNPIKEFSDEELGRMASSAFFNNMQYSAVDMLSWGLTYGKGTKLLDGAGKKIADGFASKFPNVAKTASTMFTNSVSPIVNKLASKGIVKVGGHAVSEGLEEAIQESFEEWSKMRSYYDVVGSLKGYEGAKEGQKMSSFYDYIMSPESTNTQMIAGAIGGMLGAGFNIKKLFNKNAEDAHKFKDRAFYLSNQFKEESEEKAIQTGEIYTQMAELISENKGSHFKGFLDTSLKNGTITEDEYNSYRNLYNEIASQNEVISNLDIRGKKAFTLNVAHEMRNKSDIDKMYNRYKSNVETHRNLYNQKVQDIMNDKSLSNSELNQALAEAKSEFEASQQAEIKEFQTASMYPAILMQQARNNQEQLIKNKEADPIVWDLDYWDDNETELKIPVLKRKIVQGVNDVKEDYENDNDVELDEEGNPVMPESSQDNFDESIGERVSREAKEFAENNPYIKKAKSFIGGLVDSIIGKNKDENTDDEQNVNKDDSQDIQSKVEGSIDDLKKSVKLGKGADFGFGKMNTSSFTESPDGEIQFDYEGQEEYDLDYEVSPADKFGNFGVLEVDTRTGNKKSLINHSYGKEEDAKKAVDGLKKKGNKKSVKKKGRAKTEGNKVVDSETGKVLKEFNSKTEQSEKETSENKKTEQDNNNSENEKSKKESEKKQDSKEEKKSEYPKVENNILKESEDVKAESFSKKDKEKYNKEGIVRANNLLNIIDKISNGKKLTPFEQKVYNDDKFKGIIDNAVEDIVADLEDALDTSELSNEEKALYTKIIRGARGKSIDDVSSIKDMINNNVNLGDEDAFGRYRKLDSISSLKNAVSGKSKTATSFVRRAFNKMKNSLFNSEDYAFDLNKDFRRLGEAIVVSKAMKNTYPDMNINVYSVKSMADTLGIDGLGYTIAGQIFIEDSVWDDKKNLFHENSHIYFALTKDDPETQRLLKYGLRNKKLVDRILKDYDEFVQYRTSDGTVRTKRFFMNNYVLPYMQVTESNNNPEDVFQSLVDDGVIEILPIAEQEIITDEVFAATLEGPLSDKYSQYWEDRTADLQQKQEKERRRKGLLSRWTSMLRKRGEKTFKNESEREAFFNTLSEDEQIDYSDTLNYIMDRMAEGGIRGRDMSMAGRYRLMEDQENKLSETQRKISDELNKEYEKYRQGLTFSQIAKKINDDNAEEYIDKVDMAMLFDSDRLAYANKINDMIRGFSHFWNKAVLAKNKKNELKQGYREMPFLKPERLRYFLNKMVKESDNSLDFIHNLRVSEYNEIKYFNEYIKSKNKDDANLIFNSFYFAEKNSKDLSGIQVYVGEDGNVKTNVSLSQSEMNSLDRKMTNIIDDFSVKKNDSGRTYRPIQSGNKLSVYKSMQNIYNTKNGQYNEYDLFNVFRYFAPQNVDLTALWEANSVEVNGEVMTLKQAIKSIVKSRENGIFDGINSYTKQPDFNVKKKNSNNNIVDVPYVRHLVTGIVNENRKYTANQGVLDADMKQHSSVIVNNKTFNEIERMTADVNSGMSKTAFIKKYSALNQSGKGSRSNSVLDMWYDRIKRNGKLDLFRFAGVRNDNTKESGSLSDNSKESMALNNFFVYLQSFNGDKQMASYLMDMGRFSDSSTGFMVRVPVHDWSKSIKNNKLTSGNIPAVLQNAYNTNTNLGNYDNINEFIQSINTSIEEDIKFIENQIATKEVKHNKINEKIFNPKTKKLTQEGRDLIAGYTLSNIVNKSNLGEIFSSTLKFSKERKNDVTGDVVFENELAKRMKSMLSPMMTFGNHLKMEILYLNDVSDGGYDTTDGGGYILEVDADRLRMAGGPMMNLGHTYKVLHAGIERTNPELMNQDIYNKGNLTVLNDEVVAKNPQLKGAYELLKARRQKYVELHGEPSMNLLDGTNNYMGVVYPHSANKTLKYPGYFRPEPPKGVKESSNVPMLSFDNVSNNMELANSMFDKMYYGEGGFVGMEGSGFGVQMVIDGKKNKVKMPIQLLKSLATDMLVNGDVDSIQNVYQDIHNLSQKQLEEIYDVAMNGSDEDLRNFIKENVDEEFLDKNQYDLLFREKFDLRIPHTRELIKNTLSNIIKRKGLKLETPGDMMVEKPSTYRKVIKQKDNSYKSIKTSPNLEAERGESSLNFSKDVNGKVVPGEIVVSDSFLNEDGRGLKKREYLITESPNVNSLYRLEQKARAIAKSRGVDIGKVFDDNDNHIGYYVQGDLVMATRIPSHGVQSTGFFEIIDTTGEKGNTVQAPNKFKKIIGSDNDGDKLFIQHKGRGTKQWNTIFDKIKDRFLSTEFQWQLNQEIEFGDLAKNAVASVQKQYGKNAINNQIHPFSINGEMKVFDDTIGSKNNIGATMAMHSGMRMLASYGVESKFNINIDGDSSNSFRDIEGKSTSINSAIISNIILDNSKWAFASQLGINDNTIHIASTLTNMGFDLDKVALVLNHPFVKKYAENRSMSNNIYGGKTKDIFANYRDMFGKEKSNEIEINFNGDVTKLNYNIARLVYSIDGLMNDFSKLQGVLSSHNNMEVSIFNMDNILDNMNAVLSNVDNKFLIINDNYKNSPLVQNYIKTIEKNRDVQSRIDVLYNNPVLNNGIVDLSNLFGNRKEINKDIENAYNAFYTAHSLGLNNVSKEHYQSLTKKGHPNNIFDRLESHIHSLMDEKTADGSLNKFETNLLFSKAILFNGKGNNQYLSLNNNFMQTSVDDYTRQQIINEFKVLPDDIKRDLMLYDLMENGWQGPKSLYPVFDNGIKQDVSDAIGIEQDVKNNQSDLIQNRFISSNPHLIRESRDLFIRENGQLRFNPKNRQIKSILSSVMSGRELIFKTNFPGDVDANGNANLRIVRFGSNDASLIDEMKFQSKSMSEVDLLNKVIRSLNAKQFAINPSKNNLPYITIGDENTGGNNGNRKLKDYQEELISEYEKMVMDINQNIKNIPENISGRARRVKPGKDYYSYSGKLSQEDYDTAMDFNENISQETKNASYQNYLKERERADNLRSILTDENIQKLSDDELHKLYGFEGDLGKEFNGKYGDGQGIGWRNKLAYAGVLRPIVLEIARREANEQGKLLKNAREKFGVKEREDKDISFWDKWLLANDIPSSHPAVQRVVKRLETEHKKFTSERAKRISKINNATDMIFQEKFGYKPLDGSWMDKVKHLIKLMFSDKESFYRELYGPLIVEEVITDDNGKQVKNMRYKDQGEIEEGVKNGSISKGQYEFYKATREISNELIKYSGAKERRGYIPHTAPGMMEALSRRGLLGALATIADTDDQINDVMLTAKNPVTGKEEVVKYSQVKDWYTVLAKSSFGNSFDFIKYKKKAIELNRKGINEDGTPIQYSSQKIGSAMGDVFMDRFSNARNVAITEFPSLDLNKAFTDYVDSTLFVHGNDKYAGVKKLFPFVDAIMAEADRKGHKNMYEYIDKNWKQYFVQRRKQDTLPTPALLEALGGSTDKAVKFITQSSVVYWLGIKGLLIGGGAYAIGNILAGKYKNILNAGGKNFAKGEGRFWLGKSGKFSITDPLRGIRESNEILKNAGFMDINIYDEVSISKKTGLEQTMMGLSLFPMSYSEKWIQGSHFLGLLTDEEWDILKNGGKLSEERMIQLEDEVNRSHGKGYQPTNQRMIQMYSWGNMMMQFSKFIPTSIYDKFAPEDIDRFGNYTMGAYRNVGKVIQKAVDGRWTPKQFFEYRRGLSEEERKRLDTGLMGMGFGSLLIGLGISTDSKWMTDIVSDDNIFADFSRMGYKATHIPAATMLGKAIF